MIAAVIPMKPLDAAKGRLASALPVSERRALVHVMLADVLEACRRTGTIARTFVITADRGYAGTIADGGAERLTEPAARGLDTALEQAARSLADNGIGTMLYLPGDIPGVTSRDLERLIAAHAGGSAATIAPSRDGDGTNALLLSPPGAIAPAFGPGSFARHFDAARAAGLAPAVVESSGLAHDIDTLADLDRHLSRRAPDPRYAFLTVERAGPVPGPGTGQGALHGQC